MGVPEQAGSLCVSVCVCAFLQGRKPRLVLGAEGGVQKTFRRLAVSAGEGELGSPKSLSDSLTCL